MLELSHGTRHHLRFEAVERNGDAVIVEASIRVEEFTARLACDVTLTELRSWAVEVQSLYETLTGDAVLAVDSLRLSLTGDGTGKVAVCGEADSDTGWGDGERAVLRFQLPPLDQSYLPPLLTWCDEVARMPERDGGCPDE